jgi:hypothetical protein
MPFQYLGVCVSVESRHKHVWVRHTKDKMIRSIRIGTTEQLDGASRALNQKQSDLVYPGIWEAATARLLKMKEVKDEQQDG